MSNFLHQLIGMCEFCGDQGKTKRYQYGFELCRKCAEERDFEEQEIEGEEE